MVYKLAIGDRRYSSWSLRGWLLFEVFGPPVSIVHATMRTPAFAKMLEGFGNARTVPALDTGDAVLWDSLAIAETLSERHPDAGYWPKAPAARGLARSLTAEMHSGFSALRSVCPMNLGRAYVDFPLSDEVMHDISRMTELWTQARRLAGDGPWLFGDYCAADAFFAPAAARLAGYGVALDGVAAEYVAAHLADPAFRRWRAMGFAEGTTQPHYEFDCPDQPWPGPAPLPARAVEGLTPINATCPYSGDPVVPEGLAEIDGRIVGFCNRFCRDKSVADAAAWPKLAALLAEAE